MALVIDVLRDWQPKLATEGVVLLWQPWQSLLPEIARACEHYRWEIAGPIIWDKGRPQPGQFASPYSVQEEFLWVLHRSGDKLFNYDGSSRHSILRFSPMSFPGVSADQVHCFEKPESLCEFLIRKHGGASLMAGKSNSCNTGGRVECPESAHRRAFVLWHLLQQIHFSSTWSNVQMDLCTSDIHPMLLRGFYATTRGEVPYGLLPAGR